MGTKFDQVMREQGRRATWLAERTGYSNALISKVRAGERSATADFRRKVADALEMDEADVFPEVTPTAA